MKHFLVLLALVSMVTLTPAYAHKFSTAYMEVHLQQSQPLLIWKVSLHDLAQAELLAEGNNNTLSWQHVLQSQSSVQQYVRQQIHFNSATGACGLNTGSADWKVQQLQHEMFLVLPIRVNCSSTEQWQLSYRALFDSKHNHKLLLSWLLPSAEANAVLSADKPTFPETLAP
ncbi:hypothetical protein ABGI61_10995 [Rheinheimera sp. FR7-31]|uniref:hypothetical protein n=1 Tax=Rheinheimera fenheensis TaxID=3152295 RepID=UPI00325EBED7